MIGLGLFRFFAAYTLLLVSIAVPPLLLVSVPWFFFETRRIARAIRERRAVNRVEQQRSAEREWRRHRTDIIKRFK